MGVDCPFRCMVGQSTGKMHVPSQGHIFNRLRSDVQWKHLRWARAAALLPLSCSGTLQPLLKVTVNTPLHVKNREGLYGKATGLCSQSQIILQTLSQKAPEFIQESVKAYANYFGQLEIG